MKYCTHCGGELADEAVLCPNCGSAVPQAQTPERNDKRSVGLNIIGFLFPLIGLILFLCLKKDTPIRAKSIGKWALIGVIFSIVIGVILGVVVAKQAAKPVSRTFELVQDGITETMAFDATGDVIHTMVDTLYIDATDATDEDIEAFRAQCDTDFADLIALNFGDYQFVPDGEQIVITFKFTELDDTEHVEQLAATSYGDLGEDSTFLSMTLTASNLLRDGWVEK